MEDEIKREEADAAEPEVKGAEIDAEQNDNALSKKRKKNALLPKQGRDCFTWRIL